METIRDKTFYAVVGFKKVDEMATFYKDKYKRIGNARRVAKDLIKQGYEMVVLRKEEIIFQNDNNDYSVSSVIEVLQ